MAESKVERDLGKLASRRCLLHDSDSASIALANKPYLHSTVRV